MADSNDTLKSRLSSQVSGSKSSDYMGAPPSLDEAKTVLKSIQDTKRQVAPGADTSGLDQAEADARQLYQDRANRAEWMGVAERVGNAMVKLGAAQAAIGHNVDVSRIQDVAPTDWEGRIDRYAKDYSTDLGALGHKRERLQEQVKQNQGNLDKAYEDTQRGLKDQLDLGRFQYGEESNNFRQDKRDNTAFQRELIRDAARDRAQTTRDSTAADRTDKTLNQQLNMKRADDLQRQLKEEEEAKRNSSIAAQALASQDDLSSKSVAKLEQTMPGMLGKAGLSPADLDAINKESEVPGTLWGKNVDPDKRAAVIQAKVIGVHDRKIATLRQALDKVLGGGGAPTAPTSQAEGAGLAHDMGRQDTSPPVQSEEDKAALDWAQKNPNDPRSAAIMKRLHEQGQGR